MQSHGAEMLRLACCYLTEAGIEVCAPVHDAVLIEAAEDEIEAKVVQARDLMGRASRVVLEGFEVRTDADIIRHPARHDDPRAGDMWDQVMELLEQLESRTPNPAETGRTNNDEPIANA